MGCVWVERSFRVLALGYVRVAPGAVGALSLSHARHAGSGTAGPNEIPNGAKGPTANKGQLKSAEDGPARDQQVAGTKEDDDDLEEVELFSRAAKVEPEGGEKASPFIDAVPQAKSNDPVQQAAVARKQQGIKASFGVCVLEVLRCA